MNDTYKARCAFCFGTGHYANGKSCNHCKGDGYTYVPAPAVGQIVHGDPQPASQKFPFPPPSDHGMDANSYNQHIIELAKKQMAQAMGIPGAAPPKAKQLTAKGEAIKAEWEHLYKAEGCTCSAVHNPPCRHCAHPGHPYKLNNTRDLWEEIPDPTAAEKKANAIMEAIRELAGKSS